MPPPDIASAERLGASLGRVARRIRASCLLRSAAAASIASAMVIVILAGGSRPLLIALATSTGLAVFAFSAWRSRGTWTNRAAAAALERVHPESRNLIVTAEELLRVPERARPAVRATVIDRASASLQHTSGVAAVPLRRELGVVVVALTLLGLAAAGVPRRAASVVRDVAHLALGESVPGSRGMTVTATVIPPSYLGLPEQTLENPGRVDAVAGSRLKLSISGEGLLRLRFGTKPLTTSSTGSRTLGAELLLTESGYLAIDTDSASPASAQRLVAVSVIPDRPPAIRIAQPGKDLLVPDTRPTVAITTSAMDDFGLRALELRYTKVSGSGEQFEFEEGILPLNLARKSAREWSGEGALALSGLQLQPGDSLVYRVIGRDARPGDAGLASSDTFFIEVAGPGQVALTGFELPPERERYALSQQMIVLKIQRLRAREAALSRDALVEETLAIAAEQRAVRANFIFLTGGHVEDEEQEAEQSHEIQEGRLENTARREIGIAIQHMSRADQSLVAVNTRVALSAARAAVEALQRAFGRNRYILRTLPVRSRIDPARRLSGKLEDASDAERERVEAAADPSAAAARRLLSRLIDMKPELTSGGSEKRSSDLTALAEEALSVDAGSEEWQRISREIVSLQALAAAGGRGQVDAKVTEIAQQLLAELKKDAIASPAADRTDKALRSAWAAERSRR